MFNWQTIAQQIALTTGRRFNIQTRYSVAGGSINQSYSISDGEQRYFVKLNRADREGMFAAEAAGLKEIQASQSILAPKVICLGQSDRHAYLVLEHISFAQHGNQCQLGHDLATMHRCTRESYGWADNNTIGLTLQSNQQESSWLQFWLKQRLQPQLKLAAHNGFNGKLQKQGEQLCLLLPILLADHQPVASLLHGDLWSGNYGFDETGRSVIFDPAVYFGDRETDLAMTELFGGFSPQFYAAYHESFALDDGYAVRKTLYNLYHILNHLNLFGESYLNQAENMISQLLAEVR